MEGCLLKAKRKDSTRLTWQSRYLILDKDKGILNQYHIATKPKKNAKPAIVLILNRCTISECSIRPFCFEIKETNSNKILCYAAESIDEYDEWLIAFSDTQILIEGEKINLNDNLNYSDLKQLPLNNNDYDNDMIYETNNMDEIEYVNDEMNMDMVDTNILSYDFDENDEEEDVRGRQKGGEDTNLDEIDEDDENNGEEPLVELSPSELKNILIKEFCEEHNASGIESWIVVEKRNVLVLLSILSDVESEKNPDRNRYEDHYTRDNPISLNELKAWINKFDKDFPVIIDDKKEDEVQQKDVEEEEDIEDKKLEEDERQSKPASSRAGSFKSNSILSFGTDGVNDGIQAILDNLMYHESTANGLRESRKVELSTMFLGIMDGTSDVPTLTKENTTTAATTASAADVEDDEISEVSGSNKSHTKSNTEETIKKKEMPVVEQLLLPKEEKDPHDWNKKFHELFDDTRTSLDADALSLSATIRLANLYGSFCVNAMEGTRRIIDELCVPDVLKTIKRVGQQLDIEKELTASSTQSMANIKDTFVYNGLIFHNVGVSSMTIIHDGKKAKSHDTLASGEVLHKIEGNELRATKLLQNALSDLLPSKDVLNTVLRTIVDYEGFRFMVMAPIDINEEQTLVYGFAKNKSTFVKAESTIESSLKEMLNKVGIDTCSVDVISCSVLLAQSELSTYSTRTVQVPSLDLEVHQCFDGRRYAINLYDILIPDLNDCESTDYLCNRIRPELYSKFTTPVTSNLFKSAEGDTYQSFVTNEGLQKSSYKQLCDELYLKIIPDFVSKCDNLIKLPLESYTLTRTMHSLGIPMRCLGAIYELSTCLHTKRLILAEAIARSCKTILRDALKDIKHQSLRQMYDGIMRQLSSKEDYESYAENISQECKLCVLDIFNCILGGSWNNFRHASQNKIKLWKNILPSVLHKKYGMTLPKKIYVGIDLVPAQLFSAMMYHTGAVFAYRPLIPQVVGGVHNVSRPDSYILVSDSVLQPFLLEDLLELVPQVKVNEQLTGPWQRMNETVDKFIFNGEYSQAISILRVRMSTMLLTQRGISPRSPIGKNINMNRNEEQESYKNESIIKFVAYQLFTCMYFDGQYEQMCDQIYTQLFPNTDNVGGDKTVMSQSLIASRSNNFNSVYDGRLLTLLMCGEFQCNNIQEALSAFDKALEVYTYYLGREHPLIAIHFGILADLYFSKRQMGEARFMLRLAHEHCLESFGVSSNITQGFANKLGILFLYENHVHDTEKFLQPSFTTAEDAAMLLAHTTTNNGSRVEAALVLHGLAVCMVKERRYEQATGMLFRALDILRVNNSCNNSNIDNSTAIENGNDNEGDNKKEGEVNEDTVVDRWQPPFTTLERNIIFLLVSVLVNSSSVAPDVPMMLQELWLALSEHVTSEGFLYFISNCMNDNNNDENDEKGSKKNIKKSNSLTVENVSTDEMLADVLSILFSLHLQKLPLSKRHEIATIHSSVGESVVPIEWNQNLITFVEDLLVFTDPLLLFDDIIKHAEKIVKKNGVYNKDNDETAIGIESGFVNGITVTDEEEAEAHDCFIAIIYEICQHGSNIRKKLLQV